LKADLEILNGEDMSMKWRNIKLITIGDAGAGKVTNISLRFF
jgi:GTPase SAR1 family protein